MWIKIWAYFFAFRRISAYSTRFIANIIKNENIEFEKFANEDRFVGLIEDYKEIEIENVDFNEFRKIDAEKAW